MSDIITPQGIDLADLAKAVSKLSNWKNYTIYALIIVSLILGGIALWQRGTVAHSKTQLAKTETTMQRLEIERDVALANAAACRGNLESQNRQIEDQGRKYKDLTEEMSDLGNQIAKSIADGKAYRNSQNIRNQTTPQTCDEALEFMNRNTRHD